MVVEVHPTALRLVTLPPPRREARFTVLRRHRPSPAIVVDFAGLHKLELVEPVPGPAVLTVEGSGEIFTLSLPPEAGRAVMAYWLVFKRAQ